LSIEESSLLITFLNPTDHTIRVRDFSVNGAGQAAMTLKPHETRVLLIALPILSTVVPISLMAGVSREARSKFSVAMKKDEQGHSIETSCVVQFCVKSEPVYAERGRGIAFWVPCPYAFLK
jgi:hypothetical protein